MEKSTTAMWPLRKARDMVKNKVVTSIKSEPAKSNAKEKGYNIVFLTRFNQEARLRTSHSKVSSNRERTFVSEDEAKLFISQNFTDID